MSEHALSRLAVVGASFRRLGFEGLAELVLPPDDPCLAADLQRALGAEELVYLATCNRVELYAVLNREATPALRERAAAFFTERCGRPVAAAELSFARGEGAVSHLFEVVSSLDSLVLGECEIAGQVRRAADRALEDGLAGERLRFLFQRAGRVARRVRDETAIGRTPVSVASLAIRRISAHFQDEPLERAVLLGVGDMTRKVAQALAGKAELWFVNRTLDRAAAMAERFGGRAVGIDAFREAPPRGLDVLVSATSSPAPLLGARELEPAVAARRAGGRRAPMLICDLGLPPDVHPAVSESPYVRRIALGDLEAVAAENQQRLAGEAARARALVAGEVDGFRTAFAGRATAEARVDALLRARLAHLDPADQDVVRRFSVRLADCVTGLARSQPA